MYFSISNHNALRCFFVIQKLTTIILNPMFSNNQTNWISNIVLVWTRREVKSREETQNATRIQRKARHPNKTTDLRSESRNQFMSVHSTYLKIRLQELPLDRQRREGRILLKKIESESKKKRKRMQSKLWTLSRTKISTRLLNGDDY